MRDLASPTADAPERNWWGGPENPTVDDDFGAILSRAVHDTRYASDSVTQIISACTLDVIHL